jgi:hypothetical protein
MAKWSKEELLGNARGLDDGYMFCHSNFPLAKKLVTVLQSGKGAKTPKMRLTDTAAYNCSGFTGSVRPPLSDEIHLLDGEARIDPPNAPSKVEFSSHDNLFTEAIIANDTICVAFTEPLKLSHKSIQLPGAVPPPPRLTADDLRIRRPRLNRGGGTIANMGTSNGQSHQSGYGSMNISSYERDMAQRTGRGNQMYQAGTRAWGSLDPTPKRQYQGQNPFQGQPSGGHPQRSFAQNTPPWQQNQHYQQQQQQQQYYQQQHMHSYQDQHHPHHQQGNRQYQQQLQQPYQNQQFGHQQRPQASYPGRDQQQQQRQEFYPQQGFNRNSPLPPPQPGSAAVPQQQRQGFDFRAHAQQSGNRPAPGNPQVNSNVMSSLKAQLASTLNKNRRQNN